MKKNKKYIIFLTLILAIIGFIYCMLYSGFKIKDGIVMRDMNRVNTEKIAKNIHSIDANKKLILTTKDLTNVKDALKQAKTVYQSDDIYILEFNSEKEKQSIEKELAKKNISVESSTTLKTSTEVNEPQIKADDGIEITNAGWTDDSDYTNTDEDVKEIITDKKVTVAVLDSGINIKDVDKKRVLNGISLIGEDVNDDKNGHGTLVSKVIINNTFDNVSILPIQIADKNGEATLESLLFGVRKAIDLNVDVINISMAAEGKSSALENLINEATDKGIIVNVAAGNNGSDENKYFPANIESAIAVGSRDEDGQISDFSNHGTDVDIYAQGRNIQVGDFVESGTSMSTAIVSTYTAMLKGYVTDLDRDLALEILNKNNEFDTSDKKSYLNWNTNVLDYVHKTYKWEHFDLTKVEKKELEQVLEAVSTIERTFTFTVKGNGSTVDLSYYYVHDYTVSHGTKNPRDYLIGHTSKCTTCGKAASDIFAFTLSKDSNGNTVVKIHGFFEKHTPYIWIKATAPSGKKLKSISDSKYDMKTYTPVPDTTTKVERLVDCGIYTGDWWYRDNSTNTIKYQRPNNSADVITLNWISSVHQNNIGHWLDGFKNGEGTNGSKTMFKIGQTSFYKKEGETFCLDDTMNMSIPNGFKVRENVYCGTTGKSYVRYTNIVQPAYTMNFEYHYIPKTYNITYDTNGGTATSNRTSYNVLYGFKLKNDTTRIGYECAGWQQLTEHLMNDYELNNFVAADFDEKTGDITFDQSSSNYSSYISEHINFYIDGNKYNEAVIDFRSTSPLEKKMSHRFTWNRDSGYYTITIGGGKEHSTFEGKYSNEQTVTYDNVYLEKDCEYAFSLNLKAIYKTANNITKFKVSDLKIIEYKSVTGINESNITSQLTKSNYYTLFDNRQTGDITLIAQWQPNKYYIKFNPNGGKFDNDISNDTMTTYYNSSLSTDYIFNKYACSRIGYKFNHWNLEKDGTGTIVNTINNLTTEKEKVITLYAQWTPITYNIKYDGNGATSGSMSNSNHTYDVSKALTANGYTRTGYTFNGWNTKADGSGKSYTNRASVKNLTTLQDETITLYAQWTPITYYIEFSNNTGILPLPTDPYMDLQTCTYDKKYKLNKNIFTREGYVFNSWNTKANGSGTSYKDQATVKNLSTKNNAYIMLYAQWKPITYNVKYDGNGATSGSMSNSSHTYDVSKTLSANGYTRTGYTFNGWNTKADGSGTAYSNQQSVRNLANTQDARITLYAQWKPITYTIEYVGNGATNNVSAYISTHTYDTPSNLLKNKYTRTGYEFNGWNTKRDGSGKSFKDEESILNLISSPIIIELYAQWKPITYNIKFDANGGTGTMQNMTGVEYDKETQLITNNFEREDYIFKEWNTKADGSGITYFDQAKVINLTSIKNGTVILYAQWRPMPVVEGNDIAILKSDGLKMIEDGSLGEFLKNESSLKAKKNVDNITVVDYTLTNLDQIKQAINDTSELGNSIEMKYRIKFSNGGIGTKTEKPCNLIIVTAVLGDTNPGYIRYIVNIDTLKATSKWNNGDNHTLLQEALSGETDTGKTFTITK